MKKPSKIIYVCRKDAEDERSRWECGKLRRYVDCDDCDLHMHECKGPVKYGCKEA